MAQSSSSCHRRFSGRPVSRSPAFSSPPPRRRLRTVRSCARARPTPSRRATSWCSTTTREPRRDPQRDRLARRRARRGRRAPVHERGPRLLGRMTREEAQQLAADPAVAYVEQNRTFTIAGHPDAHPVLGPGPHRPARPAAQQLLHLPEHRRRRDRVHHRHRHPDHAQRLRRPRHLGHQHHRRRQQRRLQRPRHARRRHRRRHHLRRGQGRQARRRQGAQLRRQRHHRRRRRRHRLGHRPTRRQAGRRQHEPRRRAPTPALDTAVRNSIAAGVTYAIAAGNSNANACNFSPARVAEAITVSATTNTDARASFSNYGTCPDIFAPGQNITSAWNTSDTATNTISGTSMATPHVAGAAALFLGATPTATPAQVADALIANATPARSPAPAPARRTACSHGGTPATPTDATPTPTPPPPTTAPRTNGTDVPSPTTRP